MKNITLTFNEALVLIAEGMTMNNVKTLANKLRNANAPAPVAAEAGTWEAAYHAAMVDLDKAKQTETKLRAEISNLENYVKQDAESLAYFHKWVMELRTALGLTEGVMTAEVFSSAIENMKGYNNNIKLLKKTERNLEKANDVIAAVKLVYDADEFNDDKISLITSAVENYYRGN